MASDILRLKAEEEVTPSLVPLTTPPDSAGPSHTPSLFDGQPPIGKKRASTPAPAFASAAIVRQEANLLRFPFFALGRRGLRNQKGLLIRGRSKLDADVYDFEYCITCNSNDLYPGQFARKVHMGLLRLMQSKQGFPFANPIEFTFRELMETMGVSAGGANLECIKQAIRSIHGTRIRSKYALKNGEGRHLKSRERGYALYSDYVFVEEVMPDNKGIADKNFLWLADWYLANINSLYCSPLDHNLWRSLDEKSPIASRLYEFFTFNFAGDWNTLPIDYEKLARFLPVATVKHQSQIEQQLGAALWHVVSAGVLSTATWQRGKHGQPQLLVTRGPLLSKKVLQQHSSLPLDDFEATKIQELYRQVDPVDELVTQFYGLWQGIENYEPSSTDRARAREIIQTYGAIEAEKLLLNVVEIMKERFPGAKSFGASRRYWPDAAKAAEREHASVERRRQEFIQQEVKEAKAQQQKAERQQLQPQWDTLSAEEQEEIKQHVLASNSPSLKLEKFPSFLHRLCLKELGRRRNSIG